MPLFGSSKPPRTVVREYGRDSFLGLLSPVLAAVYVSVLGPQARERYEAGLRERMEKDASDMIRRGYRIVSEHRYTMTPFGIAYIKVTYELVEPSP